MNLAVWRSAISQLTFALALLTICAMVIELAGLYALSVIPRSFLHQNALLWRHSDDRTWARILIYSWAFAVGVFLVGLLGAGAKRRMSFILRGSSIVAFPLLVFLVS